MIGIIVTLLALFAALGLALRIEDIQSPINSERQCQILPSHNMPSGINMPGGIDTRTRAR